MKKPQHLPWQSVLLYPLRACALKTLGTWNPVKSQGWKMMKVKNVLILTVCAWNWSWLLAECSRVPLTSLGISAPCPLDGTAPAMRPNFWKNSWRAPYLFPGVHVQCLGFQYLHESTWCFYIHDKIKDASATYYAWLIGSGVFTYLPRAAVSALEQSAQGSSSKPNLPMILSEEITPLLS